MNNNIKKLPNGDFSVEKETERKLRLAVRLNQAEVRDSLGEFHKQERFETWVVVISVVLTGLIIAFREVLV